MKANPLVLALGLMASFASTVACGSDDPTHSTSVDVGVAPASLEISGAVTLKQNETIPIAVTASFHDGETRDVTREPALSWIVEDSDVAVVDATGLVRGINPGATRIYASYGDTVSDPEVVAVH